jgi:hypothetical protein
MGTSYSQTYVSSKLTQEVANDVTQVSVATCRISCEQDQNNTVVIISPGSTTGDINFTQYCAIEDASCMINQNIETIIENVLTSNLDQDVLPTRAGLGFSINSTKVISEVNELVSSTCTIETNQTMNNNYLYVGTGAEVGDIIFAQHSTLSNVECTMDIATKSDAYNRESSDTTQKSRTINAAMMLLIVFIIVIAFAFILVVIFMLTGGTASLANAAGKSGEGGGGSSDLLKLGLAATPEGKAASVAGFL